MGDIVVRVVIEIMGRPADNVSTALKSLLDKLNGEKGVEIVEKKIHKPKAVPDSDLFTSFAELTLNLETIDNYFGIVFAYMPSHIEIIEPSDFKVDAFQLGDIANLLTQRLHGIDALMKRVMVERDMLGNKLREIAPHLFQDQKPNVGDMKAKGLENSISEKKTKKKSTKKKTSKKKK
jgi:hypothetical protein